MSEWGRVAEDGTVYVRTADGERAVGSWQAGPPEEGLALFARKYEQLSTEVALLEQRLRAGVGDPNQVRHSALRLKSTVPDAAVVGDLVALEARVDALLARTEEAAEQAKVRKAEARAQAAEQKAALAEEAERLASSSEWKAAGERLRTIGDDWKRLPHLEKKSDDELWARVAGARKQFAERRTAHFAALEQQREVSKGRKERLVEQAEALQDSKDWKSTADRFKQLMSDWKAAGRAPRGVDDELWARFKAAQDHFFTARSAVFAEQDEQLRGNQQVKEEILVEAEALAAGLDDGSLPLEKAKSRLRSLQDRWEKAGKVPREAMRPLEGRMAAVEEKVRAADSSRFARPEESPFLVRLREKVAELEGKLDKARAAGRPTEEIEAALTTQRQWLEQAGGSVAPAPPKDKPKRDKRQTSAWVRADG
jgi:DNA repair exonuclease SbcCD ATPase subunit